MLRKHCDMKGLHNLLHSHVRVWQHPHPDCMLQMILLCGLLSTSSISPVGFIMLQCPIERTLLNV